MKNKAFTLIEMLAVIIILVLAAGITYVGITSSSREIKEKDFKNYKNSLYMASEAYIDFNNIVIEDYIIIDVMTLLNENYIDKIILNPKTQQEEYGAKVKVSKDQVGALIFEYING